MTRAEGSQHLAAGQAWLVDLRLRGGVPMHQAAPHGRHQMTTEPGEFTLVAPGHWHEWSWRTSGAGEVCLHIFLPGPLLESALHQTAAGGGGAVAVEPCFAARDEAVTALGRLLAATLADADPATEIYRDGLLRALAARLAARGGRAGAGVRVSSGLAPWQLQRVCALMEADLASTPSLDELAGSVDLSAGHFCTAFRLSTGLPPHAWLTRRRMSRARELLRDTRASVLEVALAVGYNGHAAFTTAFGRAFGQPPSVFRRHAR